MAAGMSPVTSLQKRQSLTLPPQNCYARDVLQVFPDVVNGPARLLRRGAHRCILSKPEFDDQPAVRRDVRRSFIENSANQIEAICTGEESRRRLITHHLRLDVRRVGVAKI